MKRYDHFCSYDGGGPAEPQESEQGEWVRYEDALAKVAAEREKLAAKLTQAEYLIGAFECGADASDYFRDIAEFRA